MVKITQKISKAHEEARPYWSFEFFPPKTEAGVSNLYDRFERMYALGPEFIDVTWGAGGSTSEVTLQICNTAQAVYGLETCMHLTCTNMPRESIDIALKQAVACGIQNILALRGDPPRGQETWTKVESGFSYAVDLVRYIRQEFGDYFCIGVAAYPEGHIDSEDKEVDLKYLLEKQEAGADYVVTQLFYDVDLYSEWLQKCKDLGITIPILPGIMPIQSYGGFKRMTTLSKTIVPAFIDEGLDPIKDDDKAVKEFGIKLAVDMCQKLQKFGVQGFHFYTLNLEKSVRLILEGLKFVAPIELVKPLPWNPSLAKNRKKETVRPIFWRNRPKSYILRTEAWDDFPNGRWGDSRSPAYGELDGYGMALKYSKADCMSEWKTPKDIQEMCDLFVRYIKGEVKFLPWSDSELSLESGVIKDGLVSLNEHGFLTINSQPSIDGIPSNDRVFGWGPKNGFIYQKAYLEFFVSPEVLAQLIAKIEKYPYITYYAVNKQGNLRTNTSSDSTTAVTWGVFPGQEIIQPTIVEAQSFMAWKDEAFGLWKIWATIYDEGSEAARTVGEIAEKWYLVNVVDNDYRTGAGSIFEIFQGIGV